MPADVDAILKDNDHYTSMNANYRSYCQELSDFFTPRKSWINSIRIHGERIKFNFLYDSTAILAARTASHGIHTNLTNETTRWFSLQSIDEEDMLSLENRMWFKEVEDKCFSTLRQSNYYNVQLEDYHNKLIFGTGTYSMLEDANNFVKFKNISVRDVNRVVDDTGRVIEIYNNFKLTARQAYKLFGSNVGESILKELEKKPYQEFDFLHFVAERFDRDPRYTDNINMPYKSCWISKKDRHLIAENGFMEMPYISDVFYADTNDPNGFSPAMDVFPWVKLLNAMARTVIRAGMKQTDPPLMAPSRGLVLPLNYNPAAMNYRDAKTPSDAIQSLPTTNGKVDLGVELMRYVEERIKFGMFVPLFQTLNDITKQMSILETRQLITQNMAILGPVIGRFDFGTLSPMIFRLYNILNRNLEIPPPPQELVGKGFKVVYLGPLAKAQKQAEIAEVQSWLGEVQAIGTVLPQALDKVDEDKVVEFLHRMRQIDPDLLREDETVKRIRQHRQEQNDIIAQLETAKSGAEIANNAAQAEATAGQ